MEIRSATISFAKGKAKISNMRELEVNKLLEELDNVICNSDNLDVSLAALPRIQMLHCKVYCHVSYSRLFESCQ